MLYMPVPGDEAGGDLNLYDCPVPEYQKRTRYTTNHGNPVKTIRYQPNQVSAYASAPPSIHGVTERKPTDVLRRYISVSITVQGSYEKFTKW